MGDEQVPVCAQGVPVGHPGHEVRDPCDDVVVPARRQQPGIIQVRAHERLHHPTRAICLICRRGGEVHLPEHVGAQGAEGLPHLVALADLVAIRRVGDDVGHQSGDALRRGAAQHGDLAAGQIGT